MNDDRIKQLVEDTLRPSGPWMAIAPDTWARACETLLTEVERLREELRLRESSQIPVIPEAVQAEVERLRYEIAQYCEGGVVERLRAALREIMENTDERNWYADIARRALEASGD